MADDSLIFIHLSDIHFQKRSGDAFDLDIDLRQELENDVTRMKDEIGDILGILVTGDIAYSGQDQEYDRSIEWLGKLCGLLGCKEQNVWVIPGNHDVCRDKVKKSKLLRDLHCKFRKIELNQLDTEIEEVVKDPAYSEILFKPIDDYNKFASRFDCHIIPEQFYWEYDIRLNDGSKLRLRGLNSTIISDHDDNYDTNRLILGSHQAMLPQEAAITYLTLCHHPTGWLRDGDNVQRRLNLRATIQLFGHKHSQCVEHIRTDNVGETLRIHAGAVHPERTDSDWRPRYNFLSIAVEGASTSRKLRVKVYERIWSERDTFEAPSMTGAQFQDYLLPLLPWGKSSPSIKNKLELESGINQNLSCEKNLSKMNRTPYPEGTTMDPARRLAYRFLTLHYQDIMEIASELKLLVDGDEKLRDFELFKELFERAKGQGLLGKLWAAVEKKHNNGNFSENPFTNSKI